MEEFPSAEAQTSDPSALAGLPGPSAPSSAEATEGKPVAPHAPPSAVEFLGTGREYFRIWIANLFLSVITLGFYSPWAKVRRLQYFYRNTRVAGSGFDYHGNPVALLRGRIIAAILFGSYYIAGRMDPIYGLIAFGVMAAVMPWLINRSLRFRFYNSSFRGLRFGFSGTTRQAYFVFLALPILSLLSLFLLMPLWHQRMKQYQHGNAAYGKTPFFINAPVGDFYLTYLGALGVFVLSFGATMVVLIAAEALAIHGNDPLAAPPMWPMFIFMSMYISTLLLIQSFVTARVQNTVWEWTRVGQHRFWSQLGAWRLFGIQVTNVIGIVLTLGLFTPFAQVRLAKYMASAMVVVPTDHLDTAVASEQQTISAVGEEATDFFDVDFAL